MGHQFARAAAAAAVAAFAIVTGGCGGSDDTADPPPVLDNARDLVAAAEPDEGTSAASTTVAVGADELPAPDPSRFEGSNRVVNLLIGADDEPIDIDVWGRRTFDNGPILLASGLGFGDASEYVAAPPEYTLVIVGAGAGPDGVELGELINAVDGERITTIVGGDPIAGPTVSHLFESGSDAAIEPPSPGSALLVVDAPNVEAYDDELQAAFGSDRFEVGDGAGSCRAQRREGAGLEPEILGDPEPIEIEVAPGTVRLSIHPWVPTAAPCSLPAVLDATVDVDADQAVLVVVGRTPDGTIEAMTLLLG